MGDHCERSVRSDRHGSQRVSGSRHTSARTPTRDDRRAQVYATAASAGMPSVGRIADRMAKVGRTRGGGCLTIRLTVMASCLWLATHCGRVVESHSPHAAMSVGGHFPLPRPPTEEELLPAMPQLLFPTLTPQALSVSELRKRSSRKHP